MSLVGRRFGHKHRLTNVEIAGQLPYLRSRQLPLARQHLRNRRFRTCMKFYLRNLRNSQGAPESAGAESIIDRLVLNEGCVERFGLFAIRGGWLGGDGAMAMGEVSRMDRQTRGHANQSYADSANGHLHGKATSAREPPG
jgi:hypothetical protein